jgi:hypothetical protein
VNSFADLKPMNDSPFRPIATMNEGPLHAALKDWYLRPGDVVEVPYAGRQIDLVRGDTLIEIQTKSLASLRPKLEALLDEAPVRVVHPVTVQKWIVRVDEHGESLGRRRSVFRGRLEDAFVELVALPRFFAHPNFSMEFLLITEDEVRRHEAGKVWRRKGWVIVERRLNEVKGAHVMHGVADWAALLPTSLPPSFTTADIAAAAGISRDLAQKMAYCLRECGAIAFDGKVKNAHRYRRCSH